jgi:hypothetical protein
MYYNGTDWIRLAKGTADQVLTMNDGATAAGWEDAAAGGIASVVADTTPQLGGALDVNGQSIISVSNGDINIIPNGTGSIGLNTTGVSAYLVEIGGAFQGTIDESAGLYVNPTITGAAGGSTYVARIKGTIVEAGSGTHPIAIGLAVNTPTITNAGASLTTSATLWVQGAPSGATTNYAVYVDGGTSRFDGELLVGENTSFPSVTKGIAKQRCQMLANGTLISGSYNTTSTAKTATGRYTVTVDADWSGTVYSVGGSPKSSDDSTFLAYSYAAGTFNVGGKNAGTDTDTEMVIFAFGELT